MKKISINKLYYIYHNNVDVVAIKDISTEFKSGEIVLIMGPSGCGKTTFLNLLSGIHTPSSGSIKYNEISMVSLTKQKIQFFRRNNLGYMSHKDTLFPFLTIEENWKFYLSLSDQTFNYSEIIQKWITEIHLENKLHKYPSTLSSGQKQKIQLCMILSKNPDYILCDEPTANLDSISRDDFLNLVASLRNNQNDCIMILVTHDPALIKIADRLLFLKDGQIDGDYSNEEIKMVTGEYSKIITQNQNIPSKDSSLLDISLSEIKKLKESIENVNKFLSKVENIKALR